MKRDTNKVAVGGGCHWCTEAVFQSLKGVLKVEQGWVSSTKEHKAFSEGVIIHFDANVISLSKIIEIHLHTHKSTSDHSLRYKYRSGIYVYSEEQFAEVTLIMKSFQEEFENKLITQVYSFESFKPSRDQILNYYFKDPEKPFCKTFIGPKLKLLLHKFSKHVNLKKAAHLFE